MAVRRTIKSRRVEEQESAISPVMYQQPMVKGKSTWEKFGPVMMVVLVVGSFALGAMWNKIKTLEAGTGTGTGTGKAAAGTVAVAGKYATFKAATLDYAKQLKLDTKKFETCVQSGAKEVNVTADMTEGSALGVKGTPGYFINGRFVGGAFPYTAFKEIIDNELAGRGSDDITTYSQELQDAATKYQAFDPKPKQVTIGNAPVQGPSDAKVVIVEYSDFQCPYCEAAYQTFKQVYKDYNGKFEMVFKQFPLKQIHPNAAKAAEVAACAQEQGKFWEMHDKLFDTQKEWSGLSSGWI